MTTVDIIITPGPEFSKTLRQALSLWKETGSFIGTALARMQRGKPLSIILPGCSMSCPKPMAPRMRQGDAAIVDTTE